MSNAGNHWWMVDLKRKYLVRNVYVANRADCCASRLRDFDILVTLDRPVPEYALDVTPDNTCIHKTGSMMLGEKRNFTCASPIVGNFVIITKPGNSEALTLCEVQVYGSKAPDQFNDFNFRKQGNRNHLVEKYETVKKRSDIECARICRPDDKCEGFVYNGIVCDLYTVNTSPFFAPTNYYKKLQPMPDERV
ncbi:fucolectin-like [Tubulanus polymorphus]|uniref:fucolectin-like n=1 Tax=Tubulanus polymorphus TaxID=672921 RepID=UPI003DA691F8